MPSWKIGLPEIKKPSYLLQKREKFPKSQFVRSVGFLNFDSQLLFDSVAILLYKGGPARVALFRFNFT